MGLLYSIPSVCIVTQFLPYSETGKRFNNMFLGIFGGAFVGSRIGLRIAAYMSAKISYEKPSPFTILFYGEYEIQHPRDVGCYLIPCLIIGTIFGTQLGSNVADKYYDLVHSLPYHNA